MFSFLLHLLRRINRPGSPILAAVVWCVGLLPTPWPQNPVLNAHSGVVVSCPNGGAPIINGQYSTAEYQDAVQLSVGDLGSVFVKRDESFLYVCFPVFLLNGMPQRLAVYLDIPHEQNTTLGPQHLSFAVEMTDRLIWKVSGGAYKASNGCFCDPIAGDWSAAGGDYGDEQYHWNAECRIGKDILGGWGHVIGLAIAATSN